MPSVTFTGADGTDISTFGFSTGTGITILNVGGVGGLHLGSGSGFAIYNTPLTSQAQTCTVQLGPDYKNNSFAGPILRSDGAPNGDKVWIECTLGTLYPQKRISGTASGLGGSGAGLSATLTGTENITMEISTSNVVSIYIGATLFHTYAAETLPTGLYSGAAVQGTNGSAIRSWSADIIAAATAPNDPTDMTVTAQTETGAHITGVAAPTGTTPDKWQLESSATGGVGATDWAGTGTQTSNEWDVTSSGTVGTYRRIRAGKTDGASVLWSGWYYEQVGYLNPVEGGGGALDGGAGTAPTITTSNSASATVGTAFSFDPDATGSGTITWSTTSLPAGLSLNSTTGVVSGTPSAAGTFTWTYTAANGTLPNATQSFTLTVSASAGTRRLRTLITVAGMPAAGYFVSYLLLNAARLEDSTGVLTHGTATLDAFGYLDVLFTSGLSAGTVLHLTVDTSEGIAGTTSGRSFNAPVAIL